MKKSKKLLIVGIIVFSAISLSSCSGSDCTCKVYTDADADYWYYHTETVIDYKGECSEISASDFSDALWVKCDEK